MALRSRLFHAGKWRKPDGSCDLRSTDGCGRTTVAWQSPLAACRVGAIRCRGFTRGVAQLGSVLRSGRRGRGFESRHPDSCSIRAAGCSRRPQQHPGPGHYPIRRRSWPPQVHPNRHCPEGNRFVRAGVLQQVGDVRRGKWRRQRIPQQAWSCLARLENPVAGGMPVADEEVRVLARHRSYLGVRTVAVEDVQGVVKVGSPLASVPKGPVQKSFTLVPAKSSESMPVVLLADGVKSPNLYSAWSMILDS